MSVWNWKVSNKEGQKVNYQKELDKLILELKKKKKSATASSSQLLCTMQQLCF